MDGRVKPGHDELWIEHDARQTFRVVPANGRDRKDDETNRASFEARRERGSLRMTNYAE
jgi:hypothetical protein